MKFKFLFAGLIACGLVGPCVGGQSPSSAPRHRQHAQKEQPVLVPAAVAPVLLTPEQMPAVPPQVNFNRGQLTIVADNSTLGDILRAVRKETGASVDVPGNATERVLGTYGPGPARDVLATLLNGSHFNFVLLGSATNPNELDKVMLISRSGGGESGNQTAVAGQPNPGSPVVASQAVDNADMSNDDSADTTLDATDALADDVAGQGDEQQQQSQATPAAQPNPVKTPEQLLQELQQRQQLLQQQQQQPGVPRSFPAPGVPPQPQPQ